jgi:Arc/MetJ-type ribon-helix-helix transcriptional regulator
MMQQMKFSLEEENVEFLSQYQSYGYKDRSALVRDALHRLRTEISHQQLVISAELYAQEYEVDSDLQELTEAALTEWPE